MAKLVNVTSTQNTLAGVVSGASVLVPTTFSLRRGYEGPQVIIEWNAPVNTVDVSELRLVRRLSGYPQDETDGTVVYSGGATAETVSDTNVEAGVCYYYKLFSLAAGGDVLSSKFVQGFVIPITTGTFAAKMWEHLALLYILGDKRLDLPSNLYRILSAGPGSGHPEVYNLDEDGVTPKGQLRRLLKVFGPIFDEPKGLLDAIQSQLNADTTSIANLAHLATLVGLDLNTELDPQKMRNEIKEQVPSLKRKGTKPGLISKLRSVSGVTGEIREHCDNLLISNDPDRHSPEFTLSEVSNINTVDEELFYSVSWDESKPMFWLWATIHMDVPGSLELTEALVRKWCLSVADSSPVCHKIDISIEDTDEDTLGVTITDVYSDEWFDEFSDPLSASITDSDFGTSQTADTNFWLTTNTPGETTNADNYQYTTAVPTIP